jgi:ssDNA-binding replication factor A large subunit
LKIADLKGEQSRVDIEGEVVEKGEPRTVNLRAGGQSDVADCTIRDDTGVTRLTRSTLEIRSRSRMVTPRHFEEKYSST